MRPRYNPEHRPMYAPILEVFKIFTNTTLVCRVAGLRWQTFKLWQAGRTVPSLVHLGKLAKAFPFLKERLLDAIGKGWDALPPPPTPTPYPKLRKGRTRAYRPVQLQNPRWAFKEDTIGSAREDEETDQDHGNIG